MAKFLKVSAFVLAVLAMSVSVMAYGVSPGVDGVANSFVVVEAEGARAAVDGAIHFANASSSVPVTVKARPGWLVNGRKELEFVRSPGETGTLTVTSVFGEDEAHVPYEDCSFSSTVTNRHIAPPGIAIDVGVAGRQSLIYALPATNVLVSASAGCHAASNGLHEVKTTWLPCPVCGAEREPSETTETAVMPPGSIHWVPPSQNGSSTGWSWTGFLSKGIGQTVSATAVASNGCDECVCMASTNFVFDVYELSIGRHDFLGLDRTDAGRSNYVVKTAVAHIDPAPASGQIAYSWTDCGICSFTGGTDRAFADYFASDPDLASDSYIAEKLTVTATIADGGRSASATCTTNFTVVAVDVTIGGVGEDKEEEKGVFVQYVPDANGVISVEGTNKMATVSFSCEPNDLPPGETVTITCSGPGELYEVLPDGSLSLVSSASYRADEIADRSFKLHGHGVSSSVSDGMIEITHPSSGAKDLAKYTIVKIRVANIKFNHDTSSSDHDAINIRRCYENQAGKIDVSNGEWFESNGIVANEPLCYTTNRNVIVKARFEASGFITSAVIRATCAGAAGSLSSLLPTNVVFAGGVSSPEYIEFKMSNSTLCCIDRSDGGVLDWSADSVNGQSGCDMNDSGPHLVYTILGEPKPPWDNAYGNQKNAWTNALEIACNWADGAMSERMASSSITLGVNACGCFQYEVDEGEARYVNGAEVELTEFISRVNGGDGLGADVNCTDCAAFVVSLSNLFGCELYSSRMGYHFYTRPYTAIGRDSFSPPSWGWGFSYHEVAWSGGCQDGDCVYDACLRFDDTCSLNALEGSETVPVGMEFSDGYPSAPFAYRECLTPPTPVGYYRCISRPERKTRRGIK